MTDGAVRTERGSEVVDVARRVGQTLVHLTLDFWVAIVCLIAWSVGLSLVLGLGITIVGGAVALGATLYVSWLIGKVERARADHFMGLEVVAPALQPAGAPKPRYGVLGAYVTSRAAWRALGYVVVKSMTGMVFFVVALVVWCVGFFFLMVPWARYLMANDTVNVGFASVNSTVEATALALFGVSILLVFAPMVTLVMGRINCSMVEGLLGPDRNQRLVAQVVEASSRRDAAVEAAEAERRRIERDLHDGAQQRLVALGMTIGLAKEKLELHPEEAKELLNEAHLEAKSAMTELRSIARGIHPAILDDRGLDAALSAVAARSPIPVRAHIDTTERFGTRIEGAAYYVVSEALTNVAKHAYATSAEVYVERAHRNGLPVVLVTITDDGIGGAMLTDGGGLAGLRDRVVGLGGELHLLSPVGGPTTLAAEIPR